MWTKPSIKKRNHKLPGEFFVKTSLRLVWLRVGTCLRVFVNISWKSQLQVTELFRAATFECSEKELHTSFCVVVPSVSFYEEELFPWTSCSEVACE